MARNYTSHDLNEMGNPKMFVDNKPHHRFNYERGLLEKTNRTLVENFQKCARWIEENCPGLNGEFNCEHNTYHWTKIVVEDGKAYLETGSHGYPFDMAISLTETATASPGSCSSEKFAFKNCFFFRNDRLEEFLGQWQRIKYAICREYEKYKNIYDSGFQA